jgi:hypothetical protein
MYRLCTRLNTSGAALAVVAVSALSCSSPSTPPAASSRTAGQLSPFLTRSPELWGDLKPVVSVKELMRDMLDPASDYIFDAVKLTITKNGAVETVPKTEEDWNKIRTGAVTLAEGVYLLKMQRPFAPPGDENNSSGAVATELSPAQIKAKLEHDPVLWNAKIEALRNVALEVMDIVKAKRTSELWDAGGNLDQACESCHLEYWYPGDKALLEKIDRDIEKRHEQSRSGKPGGRGR